MEEKEETKWKKKLSENKKKKLSGIPGRNYVEGRGKLSGRKGRN